MNYLKDIRKVIYKMYNVTVQISNLNNSLHYLLLINIHIYTYIYMYNVIFVH